MSDAVCPHPALLLCMLILSVPFHWRLVHGAKCHSTVNAFPLMWQTSLFLALEWPPVVPVQLDVESPGEGK